MNIASKIEAYLENVFRANFTVEKKHGANEEYIITIGESNKQYFYLDVVVKNDIRLTIMCEPENYAADFLRAIDRADEAKRKVFCDYWEQIGLDKISIKINEIPIKKEDVLTKPTKWNKFSMRFTKAPFFDDENEDRDLVICKYAKQVISMVLSLTDYSIQGYEEGKEYTVTQTKHERNPINRELCLLAKGYVCSVCGFDFAKKYGSIGENFIEVHHSIPVAEMEDGHIVDPIKELFPVCSNCHSMIHRKKPPYTIDELKNIIKGE